MKRSEMVKRIEQMLISCTTDDIQPLSIIADNAVYLCSDAGMLPPLKESKEFGVTGTIDHNGRMHFKFEWDPE